MKNYTITVNGVAYEVTVQEGTGAPQAAPTPAPATTPAPAPTPAPVPTPAPAPKVAPAPAGSQGSIEVESPMPGKILSVAVSVGQAVSKGEVVVVLEAMKMENEIVATEDGTVASVNVTAGQMVESGDVIATLN